MLPLILDLLYLLSLDESDLLDDESDDDWSDYRSSFMCAFYSRFDESFVSVSGVGSGFFVLIGVLSDCDVVVFMVFLRIGVEYKGGQLIDQ